MALTQLGTFTFTYRVTSSSYRKALWTNNSVDITAAAVYNKDTQITTILASSTETNERWRDFTKIIFGSAVGAQPIVGFSIIASDDNYYNMIVTYMNNKGEFVNRILNGIAGQDLSIEIPIFLASGSSGRGNINLSTVDPNTAIEALVDGTMTEINNTPKTVNITDGNVVIDVASHSPKDKYTVQLNNGDNMLRIVDGSMQYNSFPASIPVEANKTLTAYGEPDREITINYTNTGTPVITNT